MGLLDGTPIIGVGWRGFDFFTTSQNLVGTMLSITFPSGCMRWTNDKITSHWITNFIDHKWGTPSNPIMNPPSCGPFGTRWSRSTNGGLTSHPNLSSSSTIFLSFFFSFFLASHRQVKELNTYYEIAFMPKEVGGGSSLSCMHFARLALATIIVFMETSSLWRHDS